MTEPDDRSYALPSLVGRHVLLRPMAPVDHDWLYKQAIDPEVGGHWRLHGVVPSFEVFLRILLNGSEANMIVADLRTNHALGMVQLLNQDDRHGYAYLSLFFSADAQGKAWPLEGLPLFLRHVFFVYNLRKLYIESLMPEMDRYDSLVGKLLVEEGRLRDHERVGDRYYDNVTLALYRDVWLDFERQIFR